MRVENRMLQDFADVTVFVVFNTLLKQHFSYSFHEAQTSVFKKQHLEVLTMHMNAGMLPYKDNLTKLHLKGRIKVQWAFFIGGLKC